MTGWFTPDGVFVWVTIAIGAVLTVLALRSTLYFWRQERNLGGSWLVQLLFRSSLTITVVAAWFTFARIYTVFQGRQGWISIISGIALIWLLLLPPLKEREFRKRAG